MLPRKELLKGIRDMIEEPDVITSGLYDIGVMSVDFRCSYSVTVISVDFYDDGEYKVEGYNDTFDFKNDSENEFVNVIRAYKRLLYIVETFNLDKRN